MKKLYIILPIVTMLIVASCQATPTPLDPASIQNTAVAMAWTTVAQTQAVGLAATVNTQGTQIAILSQPTVAITPTPNLLMIEDNGIKIALLAVLGGSESGFSYGQQYNDRKLAIGYYSRVNGIVRDDGFWIAQRDSNELWDIIYISHGIPPCKELQKFNFDNTVPVQCLDANGNPIMLWQWQGQ